MRRLDQTAIRNRLAATHGSYFSDIDVVAEIDSTNEALLRRATAGGRVDGHAIVAECQTAGRGRQDSQWFSPPVGNIYLSVGMKMSPDERYTGLSIAIGVAIARALGGERVKLKWPNDIYVDGRKLGGILVESTAEGECVVGIGINVLMRREDVTSETDIDQPWTSLAEEFGDINREDLLVRILEELSVTIFSFKASRLKTFMQDWRRMDAFCGKQVRLTLNAERKVEGKVMGIAHDGAILINTDGTTEPYYSGELRLLEG